MHKDFRSLLLLLLHGGAFHIYLVFQDPVHILSSICFWVQTHFLSSPKHQRRDVTQWYSTCLAYRKDQVQCLVLLPGHLCSPDLAAALPCPCATQARCSDAGVEKVPLLFHPIPWSLLGLALKQSLSQYPQ